MGIAFTTTMLARRAQFHQSRLVEHLTPFDRTYLIYHNKTAAFLGAQGLPPGDADGLIYRQLIGQATGLAFNDAFLTICFLMLCVLPLVFLMQKVESKGGPPSMSIEA